MSKLHNLLARYGLCLALFLFVFLNSAAYAETPSTQAYPDNVYEVPPSQASNLQSLINQHHAVRLQPGDYSAAGTITLDTCQRIYGTPGTILGDVQVKPGAAGVILSHVTLNNLIFPASNLVTHDNVFQSIQGPITITGATLEKNLFLDIYNTKISVDTSQGGYLKNNRFIRIMVHGASPGISMKGDANRLSANNVFVWTNFMTPSGKAIYLDNQADVTFVGIDAESWNWNGIDSDAMLTTGPMGTLRLFQINGGQNNSNLTGFLNTAADELQMHGSAIGQTGNPALNFSGQRSAFVNMQGLSTNTSAPFRFASFNGGGTDTTLNEVSVSGSLPSAAQQDTLRGMFVDTHRSGSPWEAPTFNPVADPAGPNWNQDLASKPDSTAYIQNLVDTQGIARLPAGIYYISQPIQIGDGQGIIGAGEGKTAIIAKDPNMDMIVSRAHMNSAWSVTNFVLMDLTLQGGKNGIHDEPNGAGQGAQFNLVTLSHVTLRDMQYAGIFIDRVTAWDNNFIDHVTFYRNGIGVKQQFDPNWQNNSNGFGWAYLDKNVFYNCQFIGNGRGLDLTAGRQNNLNAWINCLFQDNRDYAANMDNNVSNFFANTQFINNGGSPSVNNNAPVSFVGCYFRADANGVAMIGDGAGVEGSVFERGTSTSATILAGGKGFFYNTRSKDMPLGGLSNGLLLNSGFGANGAGFNQQGVSVVNGTPLTFIGGTPAPAPQLLFGATLG